MAGPRFVQYFGPVLASLRNLGDSGTPAEVREEVAALMKLPDKVLNEQLQSGANRFDNQVAWARFYLAKGGYLDSSRRGVWSLTEKGKETEMDSKNALALFRTIHQQFQSGDGETSVEEQSASLEEGTATPESHRDLLLKRIRAIPPAGFERLCQRLLRESGFQHVEVTGRSGDGGIDGVGILQVNPLMSFRVLFQCKRYKDPINPSQIRDFRGAMMGRVDKGIFLTTSSFTTEARREATRDGVPPIELVDAEKLVNMFEQLQLGLTPRMVYEVDPKFFAEFE
jgi:restriction system protein